MRKSKLKETFDDNNIDLKTVDNQTLASLRRLGRFDQDKYKNRRIHLLQANKVPVGTENPELYMDEDHAAEYKEYSRLEIENATLLEQVHAEIVKREGKMKRSIDQEIRAEVFNKRNQKDKEERERNNSGSNPNTNPNSEGPKGPNEDTNKK